MNFLKSLFNSPRKTITISSSNNSVNNCFSSSTSPPKLVTLPLIKKDTDHYSPEQKKNQKNSQIITSPNKKKIHFSNIIDFIENHPNISITNTIQIIDITKIQTIQININLEDFAHYLDIFEKTKQFYKQLNITKKKHKQKTYKIHRNNI
ncbi:hypothetical protein OCU04_003689 [Sclerotinia nivalis]|uniref:Uncharacterized protein n=1 Tax=Sclerotinia nivalis TaxID=352851 RepID=A0A9X0DNH3_9HELO|nr:hypothetical protein OCU04_003689 [Sclerotinia nivalis]